MNEKKSKLNFETTTLSVVPENERKSWLDVAFIQAGVYICVPSLMLGGLLVDGMGLTNGKRQTMRTYANFKKYERMLLTVIAKTSRCYHRKEHSL